MLIGLVVLMIISVLGLTLSFFFCTTPIVWKSGKQRIVARSSTKEEYKALADGTAEIL
jgi:O-antigen/teichoic acid export membrane protein